MLACCVEMRMLEILVLGRLHNRMQLPVVPRVPYITEFAEDRLRKMIDKPAMETKAKRCRTEAGQGNVVARQVHALKAVSFLKIAHAIPLPVPICEARVDEIRDLPLGTGSDGFGD